MRNTILLTGVLLSIAGSAPAADIEAGKAKSKTCQTCHGKDGIGTMPPYPNLAGQSAFYLSKQLYDFRSGARSNEIMAVIDKPLSDDDIEDLSAYYESLAPGCSC